VTIDLLGHGRTSKPVEPARYDEAKQIQDICQIIESLDISRPFLFGYSMGGRLALKTALEAPELFKGLLLESTTCGISDLDKRKERQKLDSSWAREIREDFEGFLSGWKELELFQSPLPADELLIQKYQEIQSEQSPPALAASLHVFGTGSMTPVCHELKNFEPPVLLMAGSEDQKYQQINQNLADQFPNATFSSIKAGHRTHLDNPVSLVKNIKNFLNIYT
jgi:2-succinyl-6-hydroxy-2,4-cyclohexadiene-1-carboxylate synthase